MSSNENWETPQDLFDGVERNLMKFDLDVCASATNHKVSNYITKEKNALNKSWKGNNCWMNPPYNNITPWLQTLGYNVCSPRVYGVGNVGNVVALLPITFETQYFQKQVFQQKGIVESIYLINGRLKYLNEDKKVVGSPKFGSCIAHFRDKMKEDPIKFYTCNRQFEEIERI